MAAIRLNVETNVSISNCFRINACLTLESGEEVATKHLAVSRRMTLQTKILFEEP